MPKCFGLCRSKPHPNEPQKHAAGGAIPDDPLAKGLRDVAEVESLFAVVEAYAQELWGTLSRLKQIPSPLMDGFEKSVAEGFGDEDTWRLLAAQVDKCIARVADGLSHVEELLLFLPRVRPRFAQVTEAAAHREESWALKAVRDREAEDANTRRMSKKKKDERRNASVQASDDFRSSTVILQTAMDQVLNNRSSDTTAALQRLSECYAGIFGAEEEADDLGAPDDLDGGNGAANGNDAANGNGLLAFNLASLGTNVAPPTPSCGPNVPMPTPGSVKAAGTPTPPAPTGSTGSKTQQAHGGAAALPRVVSHRSTRSAASSTRGGARPAAPVHYARGEKVEIWSSSQGRWLEGVVLEVFEEGGTHDEYYVPPGVVKVQSVAGTKFVQPQQLANLVRKLPT